MALHSEATQKNLSIGKDNLTLQIFLDTKAITFPNDALIRTAGHNTYVENLNASTKA